ncbi:kinetochore protein Nuf2-like [Mya arenaria]|uniref:kinetochore protein Nuf2-like n=1 Tax=Mya arenaria TaxID=6604 RepID=UPI0022E31586|nr:kinetochore protein Nuf2-like [Mya arenaria]
MAFAFPELAIPDIVSSLDELCGLQLKETSFSKPDPLQWIEIFRRLMCDITESSDENLQEPLLLSQDLEYPEIYTDAMANMTLIRIMGRIMPTMYINDFSARDIYFPSCERLKKICSSIINFLRFKATRMIAYEDMRADVESEREHHETLLRRNEELKQKINNIRAERAEQEPLVAQVQADVDQLSIAMQEQQRNKQTLTKSIYDIKSNITNSKARQDELNCRVLKLKEQEGHLALKIVQSPAKVMAEQEGLKQRVQEARDLLQRKQLRLTEIERQRKDIKQTVSNLEKGLALLELIQKSVYMEIERQRKDIKQTVSNLEKGLALLELIQKSVDKESEVAADVSVLIEQVQEVTEQIHETECQKERVQELLRGRQERLSKLAIMHQNKVHILQQQIMADTEEKDNFEKKVANDSEKKSHLLQYRKRMEEDVHRYQKNIEQKVEALKNKYGQLLEKTDEYNTCIADEWNKVRQLLKK